MPKVLVVTNAGEVIGELTTFRLSRPTKKGQLGLTPKWEEGRQLDRLWLDALEREERDAQASEAQLEMPDPAWLARRRAELGLDTPAVPVPR